MIKPIKDPQPLHCCAFSVIHEKPSSFSDILDYYDRFRSYVEHEDDLINSRLTWSLTVHGFLFAVYGLLVGKTADLFVELHKTPSVPLPVEHAIAGLFFLQVPVTVFGAFVGYLSAEAIIASHNAIQHLLAIGHSSGVLQIEPATHVPAAIDVGRQTVSPASMSKIEENCSVLIYHPGDHPGSQPVPKGAAKIPVIEEIVRVTTVPGHTFNAHFEKSFPASASLRPLGYGLLPKVVSGGDQGAFTGGARAYYLSLPVCAMWVWIGLGAISVTLAALSLWPKGPLFSFLGQIGLAP